MKKIIIIGFPHCGTSILKSIIGHIDSVDEIYQESDKIDQESSHKEYVLCKWPSTDSKFFGKEYEDYIKIFIMRNPLWVFSSLNIRFGGIEAEGHKVYDYIDSLEKFVYYTENPVPNLYTIKYEDIFPNNFQALRNILDSIGLEYTDRIFDNNQYKNFITRDQEIPQSLPAQYDHDKYRSYQINQPIENQNKLDKILLDPRQYKELVENDTINMIYDCLV